MSKRNKPQLLPTRPLLSNHSIPCSTVTNRPIKLDGKGRWEPTHSRNIPTHSKGGRTTKTSSIVRFTQAADIRTMLPRCAPPLVIISRPSLLLPLHLFPRKKRGRREREKKKTTGAKCKKKEDKKTKTREECTKDKQKNKTKNTKNAKKKTKEKQNERKTKRNKKSKVNLI